MTLPKKANDKDKYDDKQIHVWSEWWREMTWPKKDNDKYKDKDNAKDKHI